MRPDGRKDRVSILIDRKLSTLPPMPPQPCIFKVHRQLRQVNEKAYEPQMLAIGPYHRGKDSTKVMEKHKWHYLKHLLERRKESSVERYIMKLRKLEERARNRYAESVSLSVDEFVEMMLLDGCFIIELFYKFKMEERRERHNPIFDLSWNRYDPIFDPSWNRYDPIFDPIFNLDWNRYCLVRDLLLFENQLPFFVLRKLCNMTKETIRHYSLTRIALPLFWSILPHPRRIRDLNENSSNETMHLLGLMHKTVISSIAEVGGTRDVSKKKKWTYIHCATKLREAGIKFKKGERGKLFDIKFEKGVMVILPLTVEDQTESIFRNLIAYEQYYKGNQFNYFTDYMTFMDRLINSSKDVELLCHKGIIENGLGDDEVISTMFNKLGDNVVISNFFYAEIFNDVNEHYSKGWNVRMEKLMRDYLHSPWALLSVLAAVLFLVLTLVQTIFSVLSYFFQ